MLAALIGVLRAGAAYVPLDREFPVERLRYMIDQSGLQHILSESDGQPPGALTRDRIMLDVALLIERGRDLAAEGDRTSTRLNSNHQCASPMPSSACKKKRL